MRLLLLALAALTIAACAEKSGVTAEPSRPDFRAALDAHLASITAKDLEAYKPTITGNDDLMIIFPEGEVIETTKDVIAFHEEWFQDANWRMDIEIVKIMEGADTSAALLKYYYRDAPEGEPRSSWLFLLFQLEDGEWRLVHDQNTRIVAQADGGVE